ncbi:MAG TPA: asparagine synthase (glutamine-hydrolyzing) [Sphingomicrobium sp.]|nr:asparagine synthase (glutamine-hydrolyzing) [Sphingomicrobium sp.]
MCGIAGIIGAGASDERFVRRVAASLAHRGPDDEGLWRDPDAGVALVHRRLSILDLSPAGHQPMHSASRRFILTFNGEIYNHAEIRAELEAAGCVPPGGWRGHSDTETFLEAVSAWGLRPTLDRCVGMFAFALWDRKQRTLSLVRDRFGEKPLYYGWIGRDLVFASELKAIRCHPRFDAEIDRRALRLLVGRSYVPAPLSIYRGLFKLEPGCVLELSETAARSPLSAPPPRGTERDGLRYLPYWSYREVVEAGIADPIDDREAALAELEAALAAAVQGQAVADVPVGAFLSGGIDSSTVVALYQKYSTRPVRTFTIGFHEQAYNEADDARAVAAHFRTEHHERIVTASETRDVIPRLPALYDEPFADPSQIPTFLVSAFAREQVTVALSGDGGDELFGGYNRYFGTARLWSSVRRLPRPLRAAAGAALGQLPPALWDRVGTLLWRRQLPPFFGAKVRKSMRTVAGARSIEEVFATFLDPWAGEGSPVLGGESADSLCPFDLSLTSGAPDALRMMYCDAVSYLPDDILCKVDRAAMGVSLETRVPFLDHRVAAVAARIPVGMKIRGGSGKHVLRDLLYREAPRELLERPKSGFGIPVGEWIKGPLRGWAEDLLDTRRMRHDGWFDAAAVERVWRNHLAGTRDATFSIWSILMFEAWRRSHSSIAVEAA